jgi:hypothetical protein
MVTDNVVEVLAEQLAAGLRTHPQAAANALKAIIEEARRRAAAGDFPPIRALADRADDAVEQVKAETGLYLPRRAGGRHGPDEHLAKLATLAQQTFAVLAHMGDSDGVRDSGYYRASRAHAERLDAMTEGVLRLVDLVNLIGNSEDRGASNQETGETGNQ